MAILSEMPQGSIMKKHCTRKCNKGEEISKYSILPDNYPYYCYTKAFKNLYIDLKAEVRKGTLNIGFGGRRKSAFWLLTPLQVHILRISV